MAVREDHLGRGIGRHLVRAACALLDLLYTRVVLVEAAPDT